MNKVGATSGRPAQACYRVCRTMRPGSPILLVLLVVVQASCTTPRSPAVEPLDFTDRDLHTLLEADYSAGTGGLIYSWSPHMPYSVKGLAEIAELARRRGLQLVPLLDPQADLELAEAAVPAELPTLRRLDSRVLIDRGLSLHYPALLVFSQGSLGDTVLPGYTSPERYDRFVSEQLE